MPKPGFAVDTGGGETRISRPRTGECPDAEVLLPGDMKAALDIVVVAVVVVCLIVQVVAASVIQLGAIVVVGVGLQCTLAKTYACARRALTASS